MTASISTGSNAVTKNRWKYLYVFISKGGSNEKPSLKLAVLKFKKWYFQIIFTKTLTSSLTSSYLLKVTKFLVMIDKDILAYKHITIYIYVYIYIYIYIYVYI